MTRIIAALIKLGVPVGSVGVVYFNPTDNPVVGRIREMAAEALDTLLFMGGFLGGG